MTKVHVFPLAQALQPLYPVPPHWAYCATVQPVGLVVGEVVVLVLVEVEVVEVVEAVEVVEVVEVVDVVVEPP